MNTNKTGTTMQNKNNTKINIEKILISRQPQK